MAPQTAPAPNRNTAKMEGRDIEALGETLSCLVTYRASHVEGFQPDASGCLRRLVLVTKGRARYAGSVTIVLTIIQVLPSVSCSRSYHSVTVVLALYGAPFL